VIDPVTGDFLFSTYGGGDRVIAVQGFTPPASAEIISINFDTDTTGAVIAAGTNLTTDQTYLPWGVSFSNIAGGTCGPDVYANSDHPGDFGSLPNVVSTCQEGIASDINGTNFGKIRVDLSVTASQVCIDVRPDNESQKANLTAYSVSDVIIDSQDSTLGVTETLCVNGAGISYVLFPASGDVSPGFSRFDDLVITTDGVVAPTYTIGGSVSGLTGTGLALQNNGADTLPIAADGPFTFLTELEDTVAYAVTVSTQPTGQTCEVTNGSGTIAAADVTNVAVTCVTDVIPTYSVGGNVSGLTGSVTLQNNGGDDIIKTTNDGFTFPAQADSSVYAVTVSSQPTGQTCSVTNGSGTIAAADVADVDVACVDDVVVVPPTPAIPVPTLSQWALIMLLMLIGLMVFANRRRLF